MTHFSYDDWNAWLLVRQRRSPKTTESYVSAGRRYVAWLADRNLTPAAVTPDTLSAFFAELIRAGFASNTFRKLHSHSEPSCLSDAPRTERGRSDRRLRTSGGAAAAFGADGPPARSHAGEYRARRGSRPHETCGDTEAGPPRQSGAPSGAHRNALGNGHRNR